MRFDFGSGATKYVTEIKEYLQNTTADPSVWKWQGSNDASAWTDLTGNVTWNQAVSTTETTSVTTGNYGPWRYIQKVGVSGTSNAQCMLSEVDFSIGTTAGAALDLTLISTATTAEAQPDEARIVILEEDVDAVTLNTDIKAWVSRDNGTTYTQGTLSDEGDFDSSKQILVATADISGQPAGTSMRWKITTHNTKSLRIHGVGLQWS